MANRVFLFVFGASVMACSPEAGQEASGRDSSRVEAHDSCPQEGDIEDMSKNLNASQENERYKYIDQIREEFYKHGPRTGYDRDDVGKKIILTPYCGTKKFGKIELRSERELMLLLGE